MVEEVSAQKVYGYQGMFLPVPSSIRSITVFASVACSELARSASQIQRTE